MMLNTLGLLRYSKVVALGYINSKAEFAFY